MKKFERPVSSSFGLWMRRLRPWPSTGSFSRVSHWRSEDLTTIGLYQESQSSLLSTSQVSHCAATVTTPCCLKYRGWCRRLSAGVVSTVVPDSPHKLFIGGLPNYLNDDQVCNWGHTQQVQPCVLSPAEVFVTRSVCVDGRARNVIV